MATSNTNLTIPGNFTADGNDISVNFTCPNSTVITAIDANSPFPAGDIPIGGLSTSVTTGNPVQLGDSSRSISFSFSAGANYSLGVISDPAGVIKALNTDSNLAAGIDLATGTAATDRFMVLQTSYKLGAQVKGTAALTGVGGVTANFGASGEVDYDWDVVHRFGDAGAAGAKDVLKATIDAWRLPRQIKAPSDLAPGTWLVSELGGSLGLNLGVKAGYDFSWLKKLPDGTLSGNLGVKAAMDATATLSFSANGNFALALSRPDADNKLRLAVYKLSKNEWDFALNASVGVQGVLPDSIKNSTDVTDLIKAIFGTQATQLINDLRTAQQVAAGGDLTDQASSFLVGLGKKEPGDAATVIDAFNEGVDKVSTFISQLNTLGQRTMNQLFGLLPPSAGGLKDISALKNVLTEIQGAAADPTTIVSAIEKQLPNVAFFQTDFGKWLTSVLQDAGQASPMSALKDNSALQAIASAATTTLNILNGKDLQSLIDFAADKLNLKSIPKLEDIDTWLKTKIATFLKKETGQLVQADLDKVQGLVKSLFDQADAYWQEALKAAQKQYQATFVATWQSATTDTAMLDVVFDFDAIDADPKLGGYLQAAIDGDFTQILVDSSIVGITLNKGVLTHGIHRQTHVELTLPFVDLGTTAVTDAVASMTVKHDGAGRVLAYNVQAKNDVTSFVTGRSARDSQMTLVMNLNAHDIPGVQMAPDFQASFGYSLRAANATTTTAQLATLLKPLVVPYSLPLAPDGPNGVDNWVSDLDKITESVPTGQIGPALISFDVAINSNLPKKWLQAPTDPKDPIYLTLSTQIQRHLRDLINKVYFAKPSRYDDETTAYRLLVYTSLRPANSFDVNNDSVPGISTFTQSAIYWDMQDERHLMALMNYPTTISALTANMTTASQVLASLGDSIAGDFTPTGGNLQRAMDAALTKIVPTNPMPDVLGPLIRFEYDFITNVIGAATKMAQLAGASAKDPAAAMSALTDFSAAIVKAFNQDLGSNLFSAGELEMLGSALFTAITRSLGDAIGASTNDAAPSALFSISIPKPGANLTPANLESGNYKPEQILVEQKLASPLASLAGTGALVH